MRHPAQLANSLEAYICANRNLWRAPASVCDREAEAYRLVTDWAHYAMAKADIQRFKIDEVSYENGQFVDIHVGRNVLPGHPHIVQGVYLGVVVGVRKEKRKRIATVMMTNPASDGVLNVSVSVQAAMPAEYVQITFTV